MHVETYRLACTRKRDCLSEGQCRVFLRLRFSLLLLHADLRRNSRLFRDEAEDFFIQPSPTEAESRIGLKQPKKNRL